MINYDFKICINVYSKYNNKNNNVKINYKIISNKKKKKISRFSL